MAMLWLHARNANWLLVGSCKGETPLWRGFSLPERRPSDHSAGRRFVCATSVRLRRAPAAPPRPKRKSCALTPAFPQQNRALSLARLMHVHNGAY